MTPQEIDAHFDAMLYDGMSEFELISVERERRAAHDEWQKQAFALALGGNFNKITR